MSYLSTGTRIKNLYIKGVDYSSSLISWEVSDDSAFNNGCIKTNGDLVLGTRPGGPPIEDYDRNLFKRGAVVTLDMTAPDGSVYRHPRGYLYIITTVYDVESETLSIELGCKLTLMSLTDEIDDLISIVPIQLDIAQTTFANCSAAFASAGQYVYQDNTGALQTGVFYDGDGQSSVAAGEWVSILGVTAVSVDPLAGAGAIPDEIKLSYQVPSDGIPGDDRGKIDTVTTESYYFLKYPASIFARQPFPGGGGGGGGGGGNDPGDPGGNDPGDPGDPGSNDPGNPSNENDGNGNPPLGDIGDVNTGNPAGPGNSSSCGNAPGSPLGNPYGSYTG
jgi:hypothetical protein